MQRKLTWIWGLIAVLLLLSGYALWPTIRLATMDEAAKQAAEQRDPAEWLRLRNRAIKLGLDLRGGMRVVMEVDKSQLNAAEAQDAVDRAKEIIRNRVDQFGVSEPLIQVQGEDRIVVELPGITDVNRAQELIGKTAQLEFKLLEPRENVTQILERIDVALEAKDSTAQAGKQPEKPEDIFDIFADSTRQADSSRTESTTQSETAGDTAAKAEEQETEPLGDRAFSTLLEPVGEWYRVTKEDATWIRRWLQDPQVLKQIPQDVQVAWGSKTEYAGGREGE